MSDNREKDINDIIAEAMQKRAERLKQQAAENGGGREVPSSSEQRPQPVVQETPKPASREEMKASLRPIPQQEPKAEPKQEPILREEPKAAPKQQPILREGPKAEQKQPAQEEAKAKSSTEEAKAAQILSAINSQPEPEDNSRTDDKRGGKSGGKKKKWTTKRKVLLVLLIILLIIMIAIAAVGIYIMSKLDKVNVVDRTYDNSIYDSIEIDPGDYAQPGPDGSSIPDSPDSVIDELQSQIDSNVQSSTPIKFSDDVLNVLLIGTDARTHDYRGRSDSMILVSLNKKTKQVIMTSIMRDIYIMIPGIGYSKLNHSYAWGGADLLIQTIESNFKIRIDKFVQVDFLSFESVIDAVGGVDMYINESEMTIMREVIPAEQDHGEGMYHLNGKQALRFARIRYVGNADFERTQRQRRVLQEILKKAQDLSIFELNDLLDTMLPLLTTDMSKGEMLDLITHSVSYLGYERVEQRVPADGMWWSVWVDGMDCLGINFDDTIKKMQGVIYGE